MLIGICCRTTRGNSARRALAHIAIAVLLLAGFGEGQTNRNRRTTSGFDSPPLGYVSVGGFNLHMRCEGEGQPAVVIETGWGDHMDSWTQVQAAAARHTRVCVYDRAGAGWSDHDRQVTTLERMVRNLRVALDHAGVEGPYVLVGHAEGGLIVRRFVAKYPDEVSGLLLIESAHENQIQRMPETLSKVMLSDLRSNRFCDVATPMSMARAFGFVNAFLPILSPENLRPMSPAAMQETRFCASVREEAVAFQAAASQSQPPSTLGDLPLIVLTADRGMSFDGLSSRSAIPAEAMAEWDAVWRELQAELAQLSSNSEHRIVAGAGHYIQLDRPDAVVKSICDLTTISCGGDPACNGAAARQRETQR